MNHVDFGELTRFASRLAAYALGGFPPLEIPPRPQVMILVVSIVFVHQFIRHDPLEVVRHTDCVGVAVADHVHIGRVFFLKHALATPASTVTIAEQNVLVHQLEQGVDSRLRKKETPRTNELVQGQQPILNHKLGALVVRERLPVTVRVRVEGLAVTLPPSFIQQVFQQLKGSFAYFPPLSLFNCTVIFPGWEGAGSACLLALILYLSWPYSQSRKALATSSRSLSRNHLHVTLLLSDDSL